MAGFRGAALLGLVSCRLPLSHRLERYAADIGMLLKHKSTMYDSIRPISMAQKLPILYNPLTGLRTGICMLHGMRCICARMSCSVQLCERCSSAQVIVIKTMLQTGQPISCNLCKP